MEKVDHSSIMEKVDHSSYYPYSWYSIMENPEVTKFRKTTTTPLITPVRYCEYNASSDYVIVENPVYDYEKKLK